jgi:hypothetical protein
MTESFPRPLLPAERELLNFFLRHDFPGVDELRKQAESVRVRGLGADSPSIVFFEVTDPDAPLADTVYTVPIDARVRDMTPPREVLLFIDKGLLECIEVVDYSGVDPRALPSPADLEVASVYAAEFGR